MVIIKIFYGFRKMLQNCYNVLAPSGTISFLFGANHPLQPGYNLIVNTGKWDKYIDKEYLDAYLFPTNCNELIDAKTYKQILDESGFDTKICEVKLVKYPCQNIKFMRDLCISVDPFIKCIPEKLKDDYIDDIVWAMFQIGLITGCENYINESNNGNECCKYTINYHLVVVHAEKK